MLDQSVSRHQRMSFYNPSSCPRDITISAFPLTTDISPDPQNTEMYSSDYFSSDGSQSSDSYVTVAENAQHHTSPDEQQRHRTPVAGHLHVSDNRRNSIPPAGSLRQSVAIHKKRNSGNILHHSRHVSSLTDAINNPFACTAKYVNNHLHARQQLWQEYKASGLHKQEAKRVGADSVRDRRFSTGDSNKNEYMDPQNQKQTCLKVQRTMSKIINDLNTRDNPDLDCNVRPPIPPKLVLQPLLGKPGKKYRAKMPLPCDQVIEELSTAKEVLPRDRLGSNRLSVASLTKFSRRNSGLPLPPLPPSHVKCYVGDEENIYEEIDENCLSEDDSNVYETIDTAFRFTQPHTPSTNTLNRSTHPGSILSHRMSSDLNTSPQYISANGITASKGSTPLHNVLPNCSTIPCQNTTAHQTNVNISGYLLPVEDHVKLPLSPPRPVSNCNFISRNQTPLSHIWKSNLHPTASNTKSTTPRIGSKTHKSCAKQLMSRRYSLEKWHTPTCTGRNIHPDNVVRGCDIVDMGSSKLYTVSDVITSMEQLMSDNNVCV